ncbi:hypothetical protein NPIL_24861 [Nephila pilipes]|uniref:Uncharacterized protein n=1 Tax=Nephila pilipes TaxID=299642 RepID=A0A8X6P0Z2_NEPPI|nr:hypothetical protein NPIL_24861 [Nephila pilipes]
MITEADALCSVDLFYWTSNEIGYGTFLVHSIDQSGSPIPASCHNPFIVLAWPASTVAISTRVSINLNHKFSPLSPKSGYLKNSK